MALITYFSPYELCINAELRHLKNSGNLPRKFYCHRFMLHPTVASTTQQYRQRVVTMALNLTQDTALSAGKYERLLLDQFAQGTLTIDQVVDLVGRQKQQ
jgi:hypothetical protein